MKRPRTVQDPILPLLVAPDDPDPVRLQDQDKVHDHVLDLLQLLDDQDLNLDQSRNPDQDLPQAHEVDLDQDHPHVRKVLRGQNKNLSDERMTNK